VTITARIFMTLLGLLVALLGTIGVGIVALSYMNDQEQSWLEYRQLPFQVTVDRVRQGDYVPVRVSRCNNSDRTHSYIVDRSFEDMATRQPRSRSSSIFLMPPGCEDSIAHAAQVPSDLAPGRYRIVGITEVHTEHRAIFIDWSTTEFEVIE
jgi:hypothetical protein